MCNPDDGFHPDRSTRIGKKLFNTILSCLPTSPKKLLSDNDIKLPSTILLKPTSFNYISFCEFQNPIIVDKIVGIMLEDFSLGQININLQIIC